MEAVTAAQGLRVDLEMARRFLTSLDEEAEAFTFQTFTDRKDRPLPDPLARTLTGNLEELHETLVSLNEAGAGVFVTVNETDGTGRRKENIVRVRALWQEADRGDEPELPLEPHIVVESSPGKYHRYVLAEMPLEAFEATQERLVQDYGSDPAAKDRARVLRVPGFFHLKNPERPHLVRIVHESGERPYPWERIREAFPPVERAARPAPANTPQDMHEVRSALFAIAPDLEYLQWLAVLMALHSAYPGEDGMALADEWSAAGAKYQEGCVAERWRSFTADGRTTIKTLFGMARDAGWRWQSMLQKTPGTTREEQDHQPPPPAESVWPEPIDLAALLDKEPEPPAMLIDDWLPCGYATMLAGHGGAGKSAIALYLAACMATGHDFFGVPVERRKVLYLSCEDREKALHWRLSRISRHMGVDQFPDLVLQDLVGHETVLWERNLMIGSTKTPAFDALSERVRRFGIEVIFVDGVTDTYGGGENDRSEAKRYVNALVGLIPGDTGAVFLIHHVNRLTASSGATSEGYSGTTGWHNAVRARWYLHPETERDDDGQKPTGDLIMALQKSNMGQSGHSMRFHWDEAAHLFVGETVGGLSEFDRRARDQEEQDGIVRAIAEVEASGDYVPAAHQGSRTAHNVLAATDSLPKSLKPKSASKRFWRHIEVLRHNRIVRESSIRRPNRHFTATLTLRTAPDKAGATAPHFHKMNTTHGDAGASAPYASHTAGGYRGCARAHCTRCGGEGCEWCQ
jgi:RecA-family ATPase